MKIAILSTLLFFSYLYAASAESNIPKNDDGFEKTTYFLDFTDYAEGSVENWLRSKGFKMERDAKDRSKVDLDVNGSSLIIEAKKSAQGFLVSEAVDVQEFSKVRIEWGILNYPKGASYAKKVNNEALMMYIFFGYDKISSGSFLIPNSPYFIGLFLCQDEKLNHPYKGRYFQKGGRFVCLGKPSSKEPVISEFNLIDSFQKYFESDEIPVISGISLAVDTKKSGNQGKAAAFIKSIEFLE